MKINYKSIRKLSENKIINSYYVNLSELWLFHSLDGEVASGQDVRCKIKLLDCIPASLPCEVLA